MESHFKNIAYFTKYVHKIFSKSMQVPIIKGNQYSFVITIGDRKYNFVKDVREYNFNKWNWELLDMIRGNNV